MTYTPELIAEMIVNNEHTKKMAIQNIQRDPNKMARASYSSGAFGRRWASTIKKAMLSLGVVIDLNGTSTTVGIIITELLEKEGYKYSDNYQSYGKAA